MAALACEFLVNGVWLSPGWVKTSLLLPLPGCAEARPLSGWVAWEALCVRSAFGLVMS